MGINNVIVSSGFKAAFSNLDDRSIFVDATFLKIESIIDLKDERILRMYVPCVKIGSVPPFAVKLWWDTARRQAIMGVASIVGVRDGGTFAERHSSGSKDHGELEQHHHDGEVACCERHV